MIVGNRINGIYQLFGYRNEGKRGLRMIKIFSLNNSQIFDIGKIVEGICLGGKSYRLGNKLNCFKKEFLKYSSLYKIEVVFFFI